ncbi:hypothetical protein ACG907_10100 [Acinetobacter bereziniae]|uniref:hypothetical protein n=1 Tax=Acinetobacter bereziniae TaxID=106648 RepID=UPI003AF83038
MMAQLFYKLLEQPKKAFIFCLIIANLCLWAIGFIKGFEVLWVLGFLFLLLFLHFLCLWHWLIPWKKSLAIKYTFNYFFMDYFLFYIWH